MNRNQRLTERDGPRALHGELLGPAVEPRAQVAPDGFALRLAAVHIVGPHVAHHPREAREGARLLQHLYVHLAFKVNDGGLTKRTKRSSPSLLSLFYAQFIITYQSSVPKPWKENTNTAEQASKRAYLRPQDTQVKSLFFFLSLTSGCALLLLV